MTTARALAKLFRDRFGMHLAWVPVSTAFSLGDYGVWRDGLFAPIGNITEFGAAIRLEVGREIRLDFVSSARSISSFAGGVQVPALPAADVEAEARLAFDAANSFIIKVGRLRSTRIANLAEVARKLGDARGWRWTYKVVSELFVGDDVLIAATAEKSTAVSLRGRARALGALQAGSASAGVSISADKALALNITGASGPVGLGLFRVRLSGAPVLDFFDPDEPGGAAIIDARGRILEVADEAADGELPGDDPDDDTSTTGPNRRPLE